MSERVLTAAEAAALLKLNVETVYELIRRQGLPAARVGGRWRILESKLLSWLDGRHSSRGSAGS
ncbi:MAG: helix-turn-helix domain-containing protein [Phycisphaerae bacterium]|jgi:putative molybdopterin biosynthesis protein